MNARDELAGAVVNAFLYADEMVPIGTARSAADAILAAGYSKPRTITIEEAETLSDGAVILTPGRIVFSKYDDWFKPGVTGWARCEEGHGTLKTSALSDAHFPATVLHEGAAA